VQIYAFQSNWQPYLRQNSRHAPLCNCFSISASAVSIKICVAHATCWKISRTRVFFCCLFKAAQAKTFREIYSELNREFVTQHRFLLWSPAKNIR
jgi:hypothetical protein